MYIDDAEFNAKVGADAFHIHIGDNRWLVTNTVHRNATGFFTYEYDLNRINMELERKWKCPYCYKYWPEKNHVETRNVFQNINKPNF